MGKVHFIERSDTCETDSLELLVSKSAVASSRLPNIAPRVKFYLGLFFAGLVGTFVSLWAKLNTQSSVESMDGLGLHTMANSLENVLEILAYPVILFMVILTIYAGQQLYFQYRQVNDPQRYRKNRSRV